jgi:hypothetical protein
MQSLRGNVAIAPDRRTVAPVPVDRGVDIGLSAGPRMMREYEATLLKTAEIEREMKDRGARVSAARLQSDTRAGRAARGRGDLAERDSAPRR